MPIVQGAQSHTPTPSNVESSEVGKCIDVIKLVRTVTRIGGKDVRTVSPFEQSRWIPSPRPITALVSVGQGGF